MTKTLEKKCKSVSITLDTKIRFDIDMDLQFLFELLGNTNRINYTYIDHVKDVITKHLIGREFLLSKNQFNDSFSGFVGKIAENCDDLVLSSYLGLQVLFVEIFKMFYGRATDARKKVRDELPREFDVLLEYEKGKISVVVRPTKYNK